MTATTALTAQNTLGVIDIYPIPPDFIGKSIDACISDIGVDVVKTGKLISRYSLNKRWKQKSMSKSVLIRII